MDYQQLSEPLTPCMVTNDDAQFLRTVLTGEGDGVEVRLRFFSFLDFLLLVLPGDGDRLGDCLMHSS